MDVSPGCTVVEIAPKKEKSGNIYLPDEVSQKYRPDAGWVVARGHDVPLEVGQPVLVKYGTGKEVDGFSCEGYSAPKVKFYGWAGGAMVDDDAYGDPLIPPFRTRWDESVIGLIEGQKFIPAGTNIVVKVKQEGQGMVVLPDAVREKECDAEIAILGRDAGKGEFSHLKEGKTALFYDGFLKGPGASWIGDGMVIVPQEAVIAVYD